MASEAAKARRAKVEKPVRAWCTQRGAARLAEGKATHVVMFLLDRSNYRAPSDTQYDFIIADARHYRVVRKGAKRGT